MNQNKSNELYQISSQYFPGGVNSPVQCKINENDANPPVVNESNLVAIDVDVGDYDNTSSLNTLNRNLPNDELQFKCLACDYTIVGINGTRPDGTKVMIGLPWPFIRSMSPSDPTRFYGSNDFGIKYNTNSHLWPLDYEDYTSYEIIIETGSGFSVTRSILVTITDQNERPAIVDDRQGHVASLVPSLILPYHRYQPRCFQYWIGQRVDHLNRTHVQRRTQQLFSPYHL